MLRVRAGLRLWSATRGPRPDVRTRGLVRRAWALVSRADRVLRAPAGSILGLLRQAARAFVALDPVPGDARCLRHRGGDRRLGDVRAARSRTSKTLLALGPYVTRHDSERETLAHPAIAQLLREIFVITPGHRDRDHQAPVGVSGIR